MINILSDTAEKFLVKLCQTKTICCFDFDGTLCPIVNNPHDAKLSELIQNKLLELKKHFPIAIISGRSLHDLKQIFNHDINFLIGNHGIESPAASNDFLLKCKTMTSSWLEQIQKMLISNKDFPSDLFIENKEFTLTLHYKNSHNVNKIIENLLQLSPCPQIITGKLVLNCVPNFKKNKGTAILELMQAHTFQQALFIGDDVTDEEVFKLQKDNILGIHVGEELNSKAHFYLEKQEMINLLMDKIIKLGKD